MRRLFPKIDSGRLSIVLATILLAYSLTPFVTIPNRELNFQLSGFLFLLRVDYTGLVSILSAGLGATGMSWLLQSRQKEVPRGTEFQHYLLPAITAWAIGVPLGALEINLQWWVVFVFGGLLLAAVFYAEFIVVDIEDVRSPFAIIGLSAVGYAIYLTLCVALRGAGLRLYLFLPVLFFTAGMVSWRVLNLRLSGERHFHWSVATALLTTQAAIGLHYLPVTPVQFGLILTGLCYCAISLAILAEFKNKLQKYWVEPLLILVLFLGMALLYKS
jgi:hypothetical protein